MSTETREARLERRVADLYSDDEQFAAAKPDPAVSDAAGQPDLRLPDVVRTVMKGYADRPAVGQRAVEFVSEAGRTVAALQPRFDTVSYGQLWKRVQEFAAALRDERLLRLFDVLYATRSLSRAAALGRPQPP